MALLASIITIPHPHLRVKHLQQLFVNGNSNFIDLEKGGMSASLVPPRLFFFFELAVFHHVNPCMSLSLLLPPGLPFSPYCREGLMSQSQKSPPALCGNMCGISQGLTLSSRKMHALRSGRPRQVWCIQSHHRNVFPSIIHMFMKVALVTIFLPQRWGIDKVPSRP